MPSPSNELPKRIWEITVQVENGDWHWMRTRTEITFDDAVNQAVRFRNHLFYNHLSYGSLISIAPVPKTAYDPQITPGTLSHHHSDPG